MQGFTTKRPAVLRDGGEASMGGAGEQGAGEEMSTERCAFGKAGLSILVGPWKDGYWLLTVKWGALGGFRVEEVKLSFMERMADISTTPRTVNRNLKIVKYHKDWTDICYLNFKFFLIKKKFFLATPHGL